MTATNGPVQQALERALIDALQPSRLRLENESHRHSVPPGSESHFNLVIVSEAFAEQSRVARQRTVFEALATWMPRIHALTMKTLTPAEWEAAGGEVTNPAPPCRGGNKG